MLPRPRRSIRRFIRWDTLLAIALTGLVAIVSSGITFSFNSKPGDTNSILEKMDAIIRHQTRIEQQRQRLNNDLYKERHKSSKSR